MDKLFWYNTTFTKNAIPRWHCPHCQIGLLKLGKRNLVSGPTVASSMECKKEDWNPDLIEYYFSGYLSCSHCSHFVAFLGNGRLFSEGINNHPLERDGEGYFELYSPLYFFPTLPIFKIHNFCPKEVMEQINKSFALYWSDLESCANRIRASVEAIMNQQRVIRTRILKGKRLYIPLDKRIESFRLINQNVADLLLAIKWIGNTGSHLGKLERGDVLDAYELLEHSINKLYDKSDIKLKKLSKDINKRKGVRRRRSPF